MTSEWVDPLCIKSLYLGFLFINSPILLTSLGRSIGVATEPSDRNGLALRGVCFQRGKSNKELVTYLVDLHG